MTAARAAPPFPPGATDATGAGWCRVAIMVLAVLAAYANSLGGAFVFDDLPSILHNPSIRRWATALAPPADGSTLAGRPLLNLSFALNYALSGDAVWSYHALNVLIHALAALTLCGLVRRTLVSPRLAARYGADARWLATLLAALWAVHPLQTESVTYLAQRAEALAGLFYLLTLYCFARGSQSPAPGRWLGLSVAACLLGVVTKETVATAPLLVLLYDRTFVGGSFRESWRRHRGLYVGLAATWLVLGWLIVLTGGRGGTAAFGGPVAWWAYALIQPHAVSHYLRLAIWPHPLVFDYGLVQAMAAPQIWTGALVIVLALVATIYALVRWRAAGFLGAAFFVILLPSSSVVPIVTQAMAEHRMYLPLAAALVLFVVGLYTRLGRRLRWPLAALVLAGMVATAQRNHDYRSSLALWTKTVGDCPDNPRARVNLGEALARAARWAEAAAQYEAALHAQPNYVKAHYDLGLARLAQDAADEACAQFEAALRLNPGLIEAHYHLANTLVRLGRLPEATVHYREAVRLAPADADAHFNLANTLVRLGRLPEAIDQYREAARLAPGDADTYFNLGNALLQSDRPAEAVTQYEAALRLDPKNADAARNLATARDQLAGRR